jgi:hypothetical protein
MSLELNGLCNIVESTTLHGILPPPERSDYESEEAYEDACEMYARLSLWRVTKT